MRDARHCLRVAGRGLALAGVILAAMGATGCTRHTVGGQTVARVNGEPITRDDVALELSLLPAGAGGDARTAVLQDLIDRKLFAQEARARGEAQTVDFVRLERHWREAALAARDAQTILVRAAAVTPDGDPAAVARQDATVLVRHRAALRAGADIVIAAGARIAHDDAATVAD